MKPLIYLIGSIFCLTLGTGAFATELVYTPQNPSFGGNPLNGNFLLNQAQAQDTHKDPGISTSYGRDPMEYFEESLVRRVLNNLASNIVDDAFASTDAPLTDGHYQFGDYTIDVLTSIGNNIIVSITDLNTGGTTTVEIPTNYGP
jgi:curli production assembly/transport component CsgF